LTTPTGKIEVYSAKLAEMAKTWSFDNASDFLHPLPIYAPGYGSYLDATSEYPLVLAGFHYKARTHSSFGFIEELKQACRQQVWINPLDAEARGIKNGDMTRVFNGHGEVEIEAKVTQRIIPGTIAIPQGAWHNANMAGDKVDKGGCINTLTTLHPSPLAKGNSQHTNIAQIKKI
jgi:anaerobic selenocysteine-containing dehydrogenase